MAASAYINEISTAVPSHDVHSKFVDYISGRLVDDRERRLFSRLAKKTQIERRFSVLRPSASPEELDENGFYRRGHFPETSHRMDFYRSSALPLAARAVRPLLERERPNGLEITHLIVTSCTGFYAPGLDLELQREFGLNLELGRTVIGFMGCYAAFNGLRTAQAIVRAQPAANVLMVNLELCTLHLQERFDLESLLGFLQFADGCAASLISAEPKGLEIRELRSTLIPDAWKAITWHIGDHGFEMHLAPQVASTLGAVVPGIVNRWLDLPREKICHWAIHPGGRAILDALEDGLRLPSPCLVDSREILRDFGNMSSPTIMFVLEKILNRKNASGPGLAMAFGPGVTMEALLFDKG